MSALTFSTLALSLFAQAPDTTPVVDERLVIEQVVARHAASTLGTRRAGYNRITRDFGSPHDPTGPTTADYRTTAQDTLLAGLANARVVDTLRNVFCLVVSTDDCIQTVFRIGIPRIEGDSAFVWFYAYSSNDAPTGAEEKDIKFLLLKTKGEWQIAKKVDGRRAYFRKP